MVKKKDIGNIKKTKSNESNDQSNKARRNFLKVSGAAAGAVVATAAIGSIPLLKAAQSIGSSKNNNTTNTTAIVPLAFYQSTGLEKFKTNLRGVGGTGIPLATTDGTTTSGAVHYSIDIVQYTDTLHPSLGPTTLRGYNPVGNSTPKHLGGIIVAQKGIPTQITFTNKLGNAIHPIPIDRTIIGSENVADDNRACTHLHGGFVPWISDGGPNAWFAPNNYGNVGLSTYQLVNPSIVNGQAEYYYPNQQSARMAWYHDHTLGKTRLNAYSGMASAYLIRDTNEANLRAQGLPDFIENGGFELPIVIQDKIFVDADTIATTDPTWPATYSTTGSLWYAHVYDPKRWKLTGNKKGNNAIPDPSVIPEFFGDTMLANGLVYPEVEVEPRKYRLRILNACQARFLNLQLYVDDGSTDSIALNPVVRTPSNDKGPDFLVLGTEGGFLPHPVLVPSNVPFNLATHGGSLITAPAERWDVIVDFSTYANQKLILYNDAPAPFPEGDPRNDYFPGAPNNPTVTTPGFGPNSRQIMRFKVKATASSTDTPLLISEASDFTSYNDPLPQTLGNTTLPPNITPRRLTLNETADAFGRLIQMLGTDAPLKNVGGGFGRAYSDPPTEIVTLTNNSAAEVWQIVNLTGDTHPIHFHLVNVQIISRQAFHVSNYNGEAPTLKGQPRPPERYEQGWKETVRMNPGEVTNVYIPFKLPTGLPFTVPLSTRTGVTGHEYVWHCHILEHEEHDMMRPLIVK